MKTYKKVLSKKAKASSKGKKKKRTKVKNNKIHQKGGNIPVESEKILKQYQDDIEHLHKTVKLEDLPQINEETLKGKTDAEIEQYNNSIIEELVKISDTGKKLRMCIGAGNINKGSGGDYKKFYKLMDVCIDQNPKAINPTNKNLLALCDHKRDIYNKLASRLKGKFEIIIHDINAVQEITRFEFCVEQLFERLPLLMVNGIFMYSFWNKNYYVAAPTFLEGINKQYKYNDYVNIQSYSNTNSEKVEEWTKNWLKEMKEKNENFELDNDLVSKSQSQLPDGYIYLMPMDFDDNILLENYILKYNELCKADLVKFEMKIIKHPARIFIGEEKTNDVDVLDDKKKIFIKLTDSEPLPKNYLETIDENTFNLDAFERKVLSDSVIFKIQQKNEETYDDLEMIYGDANQYANQYTNQYTNENSIEPDYQQN
jgi:hypothetical protein